MGSVPPAMVYVWAPKGYLGYYLRFSPWWIVGILGLIAFSQPREKRQEYLQTNPNQSLDKQP